MVMAQVNKKMTIMMLMKRWILRRWFTSIFSIEFTTDMARDSERKNHDSGGYLFSKSCLLLLSLNNDRVRFASGNS